METERWDEPITDEALAPEHLPEPFAPWGEIVPFAATFDGDALHPTPEALQAATAPLREYHEATRAIPAEVGVTDLRAALFSEYRNDRFAEISRGPDADARYPQALVEAIRARLTGTSLPAPMPWPGVPPERLSFSIGGFMGDSFCWSPRPPGGLPSSTSVRVTSPT